MEFKDSLILHRSDHAKLLSDIDRRWITFHCEKCNTVLGDGLSVCGEVQTMGCILFMKVTKAVVISDKKETEQKGDLTHCIYSFLSCRCCRSFVGRIIHSAPARLSNCRSMFLLHKANISCYLLNSSSMVKATSISFEVNPLRESMKEMRHKFQAMYTQMSRFKEELAHGTVLSSASSN
ncbi:protein Mis18-beta [Eucyclogobius newberryi]|uniref:protein Mis18-beta n=1 Tax=Eucyclogobius newberryi TaxID=166745 RepID=UPI003B5A2D7E